MVHWWGLHNMFHHRLRSAEKKKLIYVGGASRAYYGSSDFTLSLTSLTGGIATSPSAEDLVICAYGFESTVDRNVMVNSSGYTEIVDNFRLANDASRGINFGVYYKIMSSTPDTSILFDAPSSSKNYSAAAHVWRNASTSALTATNSSGESSAVTPPSVTPSISGSIILVVGSAIDYDDEDSSFSAPSEITKFIATASLNNAAETSSIGMGVYEDWISGSYYPQSFLTPNTSKPLMWCASTIIITT